MRLILASVGFGAAGVVEKCVEMVGKRAEKINFAVINEAMAVEYGDHRWFLEDMDSIRNNFGGRLEMVNLLANDVAKIKERLMAADVIFGAGGNTDWLMRVLVKTGTAELLPKLLRSKVYVGSSAGACVLGCRPGYKTFVEVYEEDQYVEKYLELVDFTVLPHLYSPDFKTRGIDWVLEDSKLEEALVYAISDEAAVVVEGDRTDVMGKDYLVARGGEVVEEG